MKGFIKIMREPADQLSTFDPNALTILMLAASRAAIKPNPVNNLVIGEAFIGFTDFRMSRQQYRGALKRIEKYEFATIRTTNKGTVLSLQDNGFADFGEWTTTNKATNEQPSSNHQTTTNEEQKKVRRKEKNIPPTPKGVSDENWLEYLRTRTKLKAPNTQRAITTLTNKLAGYQAQGYNPNELIELANLNGWKSVYPPKDDNNGRNPNPREIAAAFAAQGNDRTLLDAPIDIQGSFHQAGREPERHDDDVATQFAGHSRQGFEDRGGRGDEISPELSATDRGVHESD